MKTAAQQGYQKHSWYMGAYVGYVVLVVIEARNADSPGKGKLAEDPQQIQSVPHLPEEAAAPPPPRLAPQAHEAGALGPQVPRPYEVHNAGRTQSRVSCPQPVRS